MIEAGEQLEIAGRIALAALLGAIIGLEREYRGYPAGVRTMALVAMGAALFAEESFLFGGDTARITAQIVTGIGFLGAGVIVRQGATVRGITTAATIWAAAAIGVAVGARVYILATIATLIAVILLELRVVTKNVRPGGDENGGDDEDGGMYEEEADERRRADRERARGAPNEEA